MVSLNTAVSRQAAGVFGQRSALATAAGSSAVRFNLPAAPDVNLLDVSAVEMGVGGSLATGQLSATGITRSSYQIGANGSIASLALGVRNVSRVNAVAATGVGDSAARAGYSRAVDPDPLPNPLAYGASFGGTALADLNGGILDSSLNTNGSIEVQANVGMGVIAQASSGSLPDAGPPTAAATADAVGAEGYGLLNTPIFAANSGAGNLVRGAVIGDFAAVASQSGSGAATSVANTVRSVGISNRPRATATLEGVVAQASNAPLLISLGAGGTGLPGSVVNGSAAVTQSSTATTNNGTALSSTDVSGTAGILNDIGTIPIKGELSQNEDGQTSFDILINDAFGGVAGAGGLANTASSTATNGQAIATASSAFVGGILDLGTAGLADPDLSPPLTGNSSITFGLDGDVRGTASADAQADAVSGYGETLSSALNSNAIGLSWGLIDYDRHGVGIGQAVNTQDASSGIMRSFSGDDSAFEDAEALAGAGSYTGGILNTDLYVGDSGHFFGLDVYTAGDLDLRMAAATSSGSATANTISSSALADAASLSIAVGFDRSTLTVGGGITVDESLFNADADGGLLVSEAQQDYSATADVAHASLLGSANAEANSGVEAVTAGIRGSSIEIVDDGHVLGAAKSIFSAQAYTSAGDASANTDHLTIGISDSSLNIAGGSNTTSYLGTAVHGVGAVAQTISDVQAEGSETVDARLHSRGAGILNVGSGDTRSTRTISVGQGDVAGTSFLQMNGASAQGGVTSTTDVLLSSVGIGSDVSGEAITIGSSGTIEGNGFLYGPTPLAISDPALVSAVGGTATATVTYDAVTGLAGSDFGSEPTADAQRTAFSIGQGATGDGGTFRGSSSVDHGVMAMGNTATVNVEGINGTLPVATGIQALDLNLKGSGGVNATAAVGSRQPVSQVAQAINGDATVSANGAAIALRGRSDRSRIHGIDANTITASATLVSASVASAISGQSSITERGGAGGMIHYDLATLGNLNVNTSVIMRSSALSASLNTFALLQS